MGFDDIKKNRIKHLAFRSKKKNTAEILSITWIIVSIFIPFYEIT